MKKLIEILLWPWHTWQSKRAFKKRLEELRLVATQHGLTDLFETLVDPWIEDAAVYASDSKTWPCSSKPDEFDKQFDKQTGQTRQKLPKGLQR